MSIKVKKDMHPDEVMKAYREQTEDKPVRIAVKLSRGWALASEPCWQWNVNTYAIIDDSQPELTAEWWDGFDWEFFNQHDGIWAVNNYSHNDILHADDIRLTAPSDLDDRNITLRKSPLYAWEGGKQPVPDNVEVIIEYRLQIHNNCSKIFERNRRTAIAANVVWDQDSIISFTITGNIIN